MRRRFLCTLRSYVRRRLASTLPLWTCSRASRSGPRPDGRRMLPFGRAKAVIGNWPRWKSIDVDFRNAFPFWPTMPVLTVLAVGRAETDRRRTFFHDAQFTSFFLQGAECAPTDDVTSKQRSHCGVCLSLAAAKTVEAETWGNGADTAADRGSWKRTTRWDDPSTLRPARAHGPNEERGAAGRRVRPTNVRSRIAIADSKNGTTASAKATGQRTTMRTSGSGPTWHLLIDGESDWGDWGMVIARS